LNLETALSIRARKHGQRPNGFTFPQKVGSIFHCGLPKYG
jgi:hypothetical protein